MTLELTRLIESRGKHWVVELEVSRPIQWVGQWRRVDEVAAELRHQHPESFRQMEVIGRNGDEKCFWVFTKVIRLKRYGRKRLVIVHEQPDLSDAPRFLLTDALHWESGRIIQTWSYALAHEIFHEFGKQVCGLESAQVRKEEAVTRHFRLSCVSRVCGPTCTRCRVKIGKIRICCRKETLRLEVSSDWPGSTPFSAGAEQALFCRREILRGSAGAVDASLISGGYVSLQN